MYRSCRFAKSVALRSTNKHTHKQTYKHTVQTCRKKQKQNKPSQREATAKQSEIKEEEENEKGTTKTSKMNAGENRKHR